MIYTVKVDPFNDYWIDCYNNCIFSIVTTIEPTYKYLAYINDYRYIRLNEKNFGEILILKYHPDGLAKYLTVEPEKVLRTVDYCFKDEKNFLEEIKELIREKQLIAVGVDLFYWIEDSILWQTHHTSHYALITGFDDEKKVYYTIEDDINGEVKEYSIPEERFKIAFENSKCKSPSALHFLVPNSTEPFELSLSHVLDCAKRLKEELSGIKLEGIWQVEGKKHEYGIVESCLWGLKTIINRHKGNWLLFNALKDLKLISDESICAELINDAEELQKGWKKINNRIIKYKVSKVEAFDTNKLYELGYILLEKERGMWEKLLSCADKKC